MQPSIQILQVRIDDITFGELIQAISGFVEKGTSHQISTVNTEFLIAARHDKAFARVLQQTSLNVPDSVGILWAARWLGHPLRERVTGSDGIHKIAQLCARRGYRLFLLGAAPGIAERVGKALIVDNPGLIVCGTFAGSYQRQYEASIVQRVREAQTDILLVAYPTVPQEKWIARNLPKTGAAVGMGVGAAFDFCVGVQTRAPSWMQRLGLEWLYRLIREPRRWRRMLSLPQAAWLVFWQRFGLVH
jgi:N-acetylglucosaminyldiphosphoundecaprenol N-acetyl-beta-D-mannosaminyltransferase